jgi:hypothetical protein
MPRYPERRGTPPCVGSDGDYWSKPNVETVFDAVYGMMHEVEPRSYPSIE